jgi:ABC-type uncharacterized transport system YnjBCD ATPase subunit
VRALNLEVANGEFLTLLGPSGSGKTTTLTMLAGFEQPSAGRIFVGTDDITHVPVEKRGIGMVFQNHALFPHMTKLVIPSGAEGSAQSAEVPEQIPPLHLATGACECADSAPVGMTGHATPPELAPSLP